MDHTRELGSPAERHNELIKAGAICTSYDNLYIAAFDGKHENPSMDELLEELDQLSVAWNPEIHHCDNMAAEELAMAAAEISRRLAHTPTKQSGDLVDARELPVSAYLDVSRIWASYHEHIYRGPAVTYGVVVFAEPQIAEGRVIVPTDYGGLVVPVGTLIPVTEMPTKER